MGRRELRGIIGNRSIFPPNILTPRGIGQRRLSVTESNTGSTAVPGRNRSFLASYSLFAHHSAGKVLERRSRVKDDDDCSEGDADKCRRWKHIRACGVCEVWSPLSPNEGSSATCLCHYSGGLTRLTYSPASIGTHRHLTTRVMASASVNDAASPTLRTITISYTELIDKSLDLSGKIRDGFGPDGLGILSVSNVPRFPELRQHLLDLTSKLANLPEDMKRKLEDPDSRYNFGWSHGKERVENGKLDTMKGSFYANPILDVPTNDSLLLKRYPAYCRPNLWPTTSLPALEAAFKALGKLMLDVGLLLAYHCDQYVSRNTPVIDGDLMGKLERSRCHKGRLLYYFPKQERDCEDFHDLSSWCGWHTDHGSLTGLTCGMFTKNGVKVTCPDSNAGLYIRARNNHIVKVVFAEDEIAYQIGETTEVLSGGNLCATPHCVKAPGGNNSLGVERSTFALFMQPDWDETLYFPGEAQLHSEIIPPNRRLTFGEYSEKLLNKYYNNVQ